MKRYLHTLYKKALSEIFDPPHLEVVVGWLVAINHTPPVVVVGAGFTRNALRRAHHEPVYAAQIPLLGEVLHALAVDIGVQNYSAYDAPTLAQLHWDQQRPAAFVNRLRGFLHDDELAPGAVHKALFD